MRTRSQGSVLRRKTLSPSRLLDIPIPLPPVTAQLRIVDLVAAVDRLASAAQAVAHAAAVSIPVLFADMTQHLDGKDACLERRLLEFVEVLDRDRRPINGGERALRPGTVPYYGATGRTGWIDKPIFNETLVLLGEDAIDFLNPTSRKAYMISGPAWVNNHAHVLRPRPDLILPAFLTYALNAVDYSRYTSFGTRSKLTQAAMGLITLRVPGLNEQARIGDTVAALERLHSEATRCLVDLQRVRTSILGGLLQGEVMLQESYDRFLGAAS